MRYRRSLKKLQPKTTCIEPDTIRDNRRYIGPYDDPRTELTEAVRLCRV
jgi:hypothetical protein